VYLFGYLNIVGHIMVKMKKLMTIYSAWFVGFGLIIIITAAFLTYWAGTVENKEILEKYTFSEFQMQSHILEKTIDTGTRILETAASSRSFRLYLNNPQAYKREVQETFLMLADANTSIIQIRFLNLRGEEKVRIDKPGESTRAVVVSDIALQNKSDRYYFKEITQTEPDSLYISTLDLNIEQGKIQIPWEPTIRLGKVITVNGKRSGYLIININLHDFVHAIESSIDFKIFLINSSGDFLINSHLLDAWSKQFHKAGFFDHYPDITPDQLQQINDYLIQGDLYIFPLTAIPFNGEKHFIAFETKNIFLKQLKRAILSNMLIIAIIELLLAVPLGYYASRPPDKLNSKLSAANQKLLQNKAILDRFVASTEIDPKGIITSVSSAFCKLSGYTEEEVIGKKYTIFRPTETPNKSYISMWHSVLSGLIWKGDIEYFTRDDKKIWVELTITPVLNSEHTISCFNCIYRDVTSKKELEKMAITDELSGLPNRKQLCDRLESEILSDRNMINPLSLILIEIEDPGIKNYTTGCKVRNELVQLIAVILEGNKKKHDFAGRWDNNEFLLICPETSLPQAQTIAESIASSIGKLKGHPETIPKTRYAVIERQKRESSKQMLDRIYQTLTNLKTGEQPVDQSGQQQEES